MTLQVFYRGVFISGSARDNGMFRKGSAGRNPSQILLHLGVSAQKVSKLKPEVRIRPNPFISP
jgi:hypothetical protein